MSKVDIAQDVFTFLQTSFSSIIMAVIWKKCKWKKKFLYVQEMMMCIKLGFLIFKAIRSKILPTIEIRIILGTI